MDEFAPMPTQDEAPQTEALLPKLPPELQADRALAEQLRSQYGDASDEEIINQLSIHRIREQAGQLGIDPDAAQALHSGDMTAFARSLLQQEEALLEDYPDFQLEAALNDGFVRMLVATGAPLKRVAEYIGMDARLEQAKAQARSEVIAGIRARSGRPSPEAPGSPDAPQGMSDSEVRRIDERLKRGERVRV